MSICSEAFEKAQQKMETICAPVRLTWQFVGDSYPMQLCIQPERQDESQMTIDPQPMLNPDEIPVIIYSFDGSELSWKTYNVVDITQTLHNKLIGGFKELCNSYAHFCHEREVS